MPCYEPFVRIEDKSKWVKAADGHLYHPASIQKATEVLGDRLEDIDNYNENVTLKLHSDYNYQIIPCGQCIGCRLEYSRQWANRGYLESKCWDQNWFVTLTYDEAYNFILDEIETSDGITYTNPGDWNGILIPEHLTAFMKSLRQIMKREHGQDGIRFMACGEYGSEGQRPHYHIILFNCNLPLESFYNPKIKNHNLYWQNTIIERAWGNGREPKGICNISEASWNNIAYTARYITKKVNGALSEHYYAEQGQVKEFFRVSRMPGIGELYYRQHKDEIYKYDCITIVNQEGATTCKPPKYFDDLYEKEDPEGFKKIKEKRKRIQRDQNRIKDESYSYGRLQALGVEARTKEEQTQKLVREFERKAL